MEIIKSSYIYFQDIESIFLLNFNKILGGMPDLNFSDIKNHLFQNNSICKAKSKIIKIYNRLKRINKTKSQNKHLSLKLDNRTKINENIAGILIKILNYSGVNINITKKVKCIYPNINRAKDVTIYFKVINSANFTYTITYNSIKNERRGKP